MPSGDLSEPLANMHMDFQYIIDTASRSLSDSVEAKGSPSKFRNLIPVVSYKALSSSVPTLSVGHLDPEKDAVKGRDIVECK